MTIRPVSPATEFHLNEKEGAHYISNAAALWVLGVGFAYFSYRASSAFMSGACFWFSVFLLCDCLRQARVASRLNASRNLIASVNEKGILHYGSWLEPEFLPWSEIQALRLIKGVQSETYYLEAKRHSSKLVRYAFFGAPRYDLPVSSLPQGKEGLFHTLSSYPDASHLVPERARPEEKLAA